MIYSMPNRIFEWMDAHPVAGFYARVAALGVALFLVVAALSQLARGLYWLYLMV